MIPRFRSILLLTLILLAGCEIKNQQTEVLYHYLPGKIIQDMAINSTGDIWFITTEIDTTVEIEPWRCSLPVKFRLTRYDHQNYTVVEESGDALMQIIFDHHDRLWARSYYTICRFDNGERNIIYDNTKNDAGFQFLAVDLEDNIWAGGYNTGLFKISEEDVIHYTAENTIMPTNSAIAIHVGPQNIIWVAMWNNQGMLRIDGDNWTVYNGDNSGLTGQNIWAVTATSSGDVWIGTGWDDDSECLMKFDGIQWINPHPKEESGNRIRGTARRLVTDLSDQIWAVLDTGPEYRHKLYKFDGSGWTTIMTMSVNNPISDIEVDADNRVWISTFNEGFFSLEN